MKFGQYLLQNIRGFLLSVAIPILVLGAFSFILTRNYITAQIEENNLNTIEQVRQTVDNTLLDIRSLDITLSTIPTFAVYLKAILQDPRALANADLQINFRLLTGLMVNKTAVNRITHSIYIYYPNESGHFFTALGTVADADSYYDVAWFEPCVELSAEPSIGAVWLSPHAIDEYGYDSTDVVTYLQRMSAGHGVVVCNFNVARVNAFLSQTPRMDTQFILVTDEDGRVLFSCDHADGMDAAALESIACGVPEGSAMTVDIGATSYYVCMSHSDAFGLNYYSVVEKGELYDLPNDLIKIMLTLLAMCFAVSMLMAWRSTVRSKRYIEFLLSTFEAASRGEALPSLSQSLNDRTISTIMTITRNFLQTDLLQVQLSEKMYQNRVLELTALQSQMNPHFLYNTLDTIYWRIMGLTHGPSTETKMIEDLTDLLRYALQNDQHEVALRQETGNIKSYISIQSVRYSGKFTVHWRIPQALMDCRVLKLLLQPIVENCIYHAIVKDRHLTIRIGASVEAGQSLIMTVADDGAGMSEDALSNIRRMLSQQDAYTDHIGIVNTDKRIKLSYGNEYGIEIDSAPGRGTVVTMRLPYRPDKTGAQRETEGGGEI